MCVNFFYIYIKVKYSFLIKVCGIKQAPAEKAK